MSRAPTKAKVPTERFAALWMRPDFSSSCVLLLCVGVAVGCGGVSSARIVKVVLSVGEAEAPKQGMAAILMTQAYHHAAPNT